MRLLETFHHTFSGSDTHTFSLGRKPYSILVKNLTSGDIKISLGDHIDSDNDSYAIIQENNSEVINNIIWDNSPTSQATVQATESGVVEIRILEY